MNKRGFEGSRRRLQHSAGLAAMAAMLSLAPLSAASAQDAEDEQPDRRAENATIIVTAQFREQVLQDVPISITAVDAEELEQRSVRTLVDVADSVPNVEMTTGGSGYGAGTNQAFIRGLGQIDFLTTFEPRVGFYVDDVYYATTYGSVFDVLDLERIEVLRGPQGTLFGRNSVGGAMRLISKKPSGDNSGYLEVTGGSRSRYQLRGAYDIGINDMLAFRMVASAKGQDGHVDRLNYRCVNPQFGNELVAGPGMEAFGDGDCKIGTLGGGDSHSFRGTLGIEPSPAVKIYISGDYTKEVSEASAEVILDAQASRINPETGLIGGGSIPAGGEFTNGLATWLRGLGTSYYGFDVSTQAQMDEVIASFVSPDGYSTYARYGNERVGFSNPVEGEYEAFGGSMTVEADLSDSMHVTSITAYREYEGDFGQSLLAVPVEEVRNGLSHRQFSQELRLLGTAFDGLVDYTLGGYYLDTRTLNPARVQTEGFIPSALDFFSDDTATLESYAFFGAVDLHPTDRLTLSAGLRYSNETKTYTFDRDYTPSGLGFLNFVAKGENKDDRFNPRVSINYEVTPEVNVYASYSTGFTASAFNARPFGASGIFALEPEEVTAYEAGFKSNLFGNMLRLNASAFLTEFDAIVGTLSDPTARNGGCFPFCNDNIGNAEIKGFEVEAVARPAYGLMLSANAGYTDFQYKKLLAATQGLTLDSPQTRVPKWNLSGAVQYDFEAGKNSLISPRVDVSYRSDIRYSNNVLATSSVQKGYALVNARLTYRNEDLGFSISGAVTNLFDKYYLTTITDQRESFGFLSATVGRPREWSITLRKDF
ncbi:iron complex outermembrane receptor protein [Altererythrobacter atlanticus]|uniref:Colicin I receptor n=1 Tax=Croceibacterium atlanticum TaxID=1267766 RepID=A0A0F7KZP2_9SPHN|nr:TonB-dependent receptor [Croceibacterium atlanticum]AKH44325.1 Colicin I receptor precursor [Croceibacterium atlanticum]MBB5733892.1 iron complex outermembrane receptor protein [Croceibacterium atlanticum]